MTFPIFSSHCQYQLTPFGFVQRQKKTDHDIKHCTLFVRLVSFSYLFCKYMCCMELELKCKYVYCICNNYNPFAV